MMRTILLVIALLIVIAMALVWTGLRHPQPQRQRLGLDRDQGRRGRHVPRPMSRCRRCGPRPGRSTCPASPSPTGPTPNNRLSRFPSRCASRWTRPPPPRSGEVPVGAVVTRAGEMLARRAQPDARADNDPTAHAEMVALRAAARKIRRGPWRTAPPLGRRRRNRGGIRASAIAPAHIAQGSSVTHRSQPSSRQSPTLRRGFAQRHHLGMGGGIVVGRASGCAPTLSTSPPRVTTAPTGTSPSARRGAPPRRARGASAREAGKPCYWALAWPLVTATLGTVDLARLHPHHRHLDVGAGRADLDVAWSRSRPSRWRGG